MFNINSMKQNDAVLHTEKHGVKYGTKKLPKTY